MYRSFALYKPFGVLSQFSAIEGKHTLGEYFDFPKDVYPIGRLDEDSEGLLLLSNDPQQNQRWLSAAIEKEYWVQVEGIPTQEALAKLQRGVTIQAKGKAIRTAPAFACQISPPNLPPRIPPIRYRKSVPDSWISLVIREGKNRQVRKMTAAVGFPTLRLLRWRIGPWTLEGMQPGEVREVKL